MFIFIFLLGRRFLQTILITCSTVFLLNTNLQTSFAQLNDQSIVFTEFFEELFHVQPNGSASDILNSAPFSDSPFGQLVEVIDANRIIISSFSDLHLYDVATQTTSLLTTLSSSPREITRDVNGGLIATSSGGVTHIDLTTGVESLIYDATFFSPGDVAVSADGTIFTTEFFDALGFVNRQTGTFEQIGDFSANAFDHLDIGTDGNLYVTDGQDFLRIHPYSGESTLIGTFDGVFIDDIKVDDAGQILFSGSADGVNNIHSLDPQTGLIDTVVFGNDIDDRFFSILDFDIYTPNLRQVSAVPEPSTAVVLFLAAGSITCLRRRSTIRL